MAKIILRSGYLDDFTALGENGQTIFDSAIQIRETLRLRKQQALLSCLAIPQRNDAQDKVDWYAPHEGTLTQWAYASEQQRDSALRYLENAVAAARALSQRCLAADKIQLRLLGSLLTKVLHFPASQHIYLVDDKPVITFWGFASLNDTAREDILDCLRQTLLPEEVQSVETEPDDSMIVPEQKLETEPDQDIAQHDRVTLSQNETPLLSGAMTSVPVTAEPPVVQASPLPDTQKVKSVWRQLLLKISLVGILFIVLPLAWPHLSALLPSVSVSLTPHNPSESAVTSANAEPERPKPVVPINLPLQKAEFVPTPAVVTEKLKEPDVELKAEKNPETTVDKNALFLPAGEVKAGSVTFMNGRWKASIDVNNPLTSKPPGLRYQFKNGEGSIQIARSNKVTCQAGVYTGLMPSGNLLIKSRSKAKCSDNSRYQVPEITCKQPLDGAAQCTGRYEDDTVVPMTLTKVGN
ncbi:SrfA family protein [Rahnella bruchi]|uniref:SrfA family protein n=1 Tax=Rahnella bruchi TaxID=1510573 RepID=UPI000EA19920|nr:SrfA family protein [Rahnella bruchi]